MKALTAAVRYIEAQPAGSLAGCAPALLLVLADAANDEGRAWPSVATLARRVNRDERNVQRALAVLVGVGAVAREERRGRATAYTVTPGVGVAPGAPATPDVGVTPAPGAGVTPPPAPASPAPGVGVTQNPLLTLTEPAVEPSPPRASHSGTAPDMFEEFWAAYPRRSDKKRARQAWAKAIRSQDPAALVQRAQEYADDPNLPEAQFVPHASTWLNGERWTDLPLPARHQPQTAQQAVQARNFSSLERNLRGAPDELDEHARGGLELLEQGLQQERQERRQIGGR
ncbi:helix-turn-helix domain-containing protein [Cellulomonas sp. A375-1]|uniref:helix-turn-helix domain-containing protein n=1 Tax=Cellulomonas sp. A375-1 TaxID=1672219 RepID=UPI001E35FA8E|nr:helix-turn-helix domain-containing protein [Cellulomonas sp. A375-1]